MTPEAPAPMPPTGSTTARDDLIVQAGGLNWSVRGAQLVDGQPRFDWVEHLDRPGAVEVDDLYVRCGRYITPGGPKTEPVPMLMVLRRAINEAISAALRLEGAA